MLYQAMVLMIPENTGKVLIGDIELAILVRNCLRFVVDLSARSEW